MAKTKITKKEALDKFQAAREKKRKCLAQLEKSMKETYLVAVKGWESGMPHAQSLMRGPMA